MKKIAVIILNWNGLHLLKEFLPEAVEFTVSDEADLFVADNGSTDGSLEWVKNNYPLVKTITFSENLGFAEGYNRAINETGYPFTVLLNSDVEVTENWLVPMIRFMEANPHVAALQPKIKSYRDKTSFEYAGAAGGYLDKLGYPYCRGRLFDIVEKDLKQYDGGPHEICWASGAALMVRTDLYIKAGGLDPLFFAHMEEIDLCCRLIGLGYKIYMTPNSEVFHLGGATLNQGNPQKTYLNFRNNLLLLHKNLPEKIGRRKLILRRLFDSLAFFMFVLKLDFPNAKSVIKAHKDFRKMKRNYRQFPNVDYLTGLPGSDIIAVFKRYLPIRNKNLPDKRL